MSKPLAAEPVQRATDSRSKLFRAPGAKSNQILARTLLNEMVASGRTRTEMIDFVNCFLDLLVGGSERSRTTPLLVDPETGFPTRRALHDLLLHEVDPRNQDKRPCAVLAVRLPRAANGDLTAKVLRHAMREGDVLAPLGRRWLGMVVYVEHEDIPALVARLRAPLERHPHLKLRRVSIAAAPVRVGQSPRDLWRDVLRGTR